MPQHTVIVTDSQCLLHRNGPGHPEGPERLEALLTMLSEYENKEQLQYATARNARHEELLRVHTAEHIQHISETARESFTRLDPDTATNAYSSSAAYKAAGAAVVATSAACAQPGMSSFALGRPPGHHAERDHAMGFCLFNNIAVAATTAIANGLQRVMILDWDVHHGNGTMNTFANSPEVLFCSLHQSPLYPGSGKVNEIGIGAGSGYSLNVPLPSGCGDAIYLQVMLDAVLPLGLAYKPELILVSAGFDAHERDPVGGMNLTGAGFYHMTRIMTTLALETGAYGPVFVLEGGYDLTGLSEGVRACLLGVADGPDLPPRPEPDAATRATLSSAAKLLRPYWGESVFRSLG
ncbi:MAG: histone deacetylase family protein [Spirochaetia bacterium]